MLIPPEQSIYIAMEHAPIHNSAMMKDWFTNHEDKAPAQQLVRGPAARVSTLVDKAFF